MLPLCAATVSEFLKCRTARGAIQQRRWRVVVIAVPLWLPALALAAIFTAAQIADAVRASPYASAWMRANAGAIGGLATRVESGGNSTAYNGSCCYGVLQMNAGNIAYYTGKSPQEYLQSSLQDQVDAWARLTSDALASSPPQQLAAMMNFDGRPVDAYLILACVQLGTGNCRKMLTSGACTGFADRSGTTICGMADRAAGRPANGSAGGGGTGSPSAQSGLGAGAYSPTTEDAACATGADGACLAIPEALQQGFQAGAGGISMAATRSAILAIVAATALLIAAAVASGTWRLYKTGAIESQQLFSILLKIATITAMALFSMSKT